MLPILMMFIIKNSIYGADKMKKTVLALTLLSVFSIEAQAQMGNPGQEQNRVDRLDFSSLDEDKNGFLTIEEMAPMNDEGHPDRAGSSLLRMDTDADGLLSEKEYNERQRRDQGGNRGG